MNVVVAEVQQPSLWASIREAVRGSHQDFTRGSLNRAILLLAIPMVLEMVLESLFAVVDVFWVGRVGANAVATVGLTESLMLLIFAIGMGLSLSTTAMVARRIGEKDPQDAAVAGVQAIILGLAISVLVGIPALIFAPTLLHLMGASPEIVGDGKRVCADRVGRQRRGAAAVFEQCDFSRRGRCGHRHAAAVGVEHHQFDSGSVPDFRLGTVSATGRDGRGAGDVYRARHRRAVPVLPPAPRDGAHSRAAAADSREFRRDRGGWCACR